MKNDNFTSYRVYACLPFIALADKLYCKMGPILFWPASQYKQFIPSASYSAFHSYIESIARIKTKIMDKENPVDTMKLAPEGITCISIADSVPDDRKEIILIDSLYLLYFSCTFRDLYYGNEIPSFAAFTKIVPASLPFIDNRAGWERLHIQEIDREPTICLAMPNTELSVCFGSMLESVFSVGPIFTETAEKYKRIIRSIRYLVDRFSHKFINPVHTGLDFSEMAYEPEDIIFLASGFECLFLVNEKQAAFDFKHKLRTLLHLKFSTPLEIFWKWVDDFYALRRKIVHDGQTVDSTFRGNPNFAASHIAIGIKLFVYSIYHTLYSLHLLKSTHREDTALPTDFSMIHPEEILLLFWTETGLLKKIKLLLSKITKGKELSEEDASEIRFLTGMYVSMHEKYYNRPELSSIRFIPSSKVQMINDVEEIQGLIEEKEKSGDKSPLIHKKFRSMIKKAVIEDKTDS